jgi:hypothetical protein
MMRFARSKADPCLFFKWTTYGLVVWISWVDDFLICGPKEGVMESKAQMMDVFECDDIGEMKEYVGCKVERNDKLVKMTQPVLLQSYSDEFDLPEGATPKTPAVPGQVLHKPREGEGIEPQEQGTYRSGVGKLLHTAKWTRPDILNPVRDLSRYMSGASQAHMTAMKRVMKYLVGTPNRGLVLHPRRKWDGSKGFKFRITGKSDSDYAKDPDKNRSVSGYAAFLEDAPVTSKSRMQATVALSVTEAEFIAACQCAQDMLFIMRILESMGLLVEKPMMLQVDNKAVVDLVNNWSVGGRTRHVSVRQSFLRELKEEGVLRVEWISTDDNSVDMYTKNLSGPLHEKHARAFVGEDEYMRGGLDRVTNEDEM